jgi:hypothetical protein
MRSARALFVVATLGLCQLACLSPLGADPPAREQLDSLMARWIDALRSEDIDTLLGCYWPGAVSITYDPGGGSELLEGTAAIRVSTEAVFAAYDYPSLGLEYPEPARFFPSRDDLPVYIYNYVDYRFIDIFYFQSRAGEYRILRHVLLVDPQG